MLRSARLPPAVAAGDVAGEPYVTDFFGGTAGSYTSNWRSMDVNQVLGAITPVVPATRLAVPPPRPAPSSLWARQYGVFLRPMGW